MVDLQISEWVELWLRVDGATIVVPELIGLVDPPLTLAAELVPLLEMEDEAEPDPFREPEAESRSLDPPDAELDLVIGVSPSSVPPLEVVTLAMLVV
jgi:hypothetical protein